MSSTATTNPTPAFPPSTELPPTPEPRTLVLCFDGTAAEYNEYDTNVVKLFGLLVKDDFRTQLCYYQSGIGTYFDPSIVSPVFEWVAKRLDQAVAFYLNQHVMDGYRFLMQNYHTGDKICLFGFSRGAYTARALAGMLHKVGLLPRSNSQQVPFAYKMYQKTSASGIKLAEGYKKMFCQDVKIDFLGCWETVASVGVLMGRTLPFTAINSSIKTFRHALALDEHRVRFQPYLIEPKPSPDDTDPYPHTDVLEVWFAGTHGDIGGGDEQDSVERSLADIGLRWMIRQLVAAECGIRFDADALARAQITLEDCPPSVPVKGDGSPIFSVDNDHPIESVDAVQLLHDALKFVGPGAGGGSGNGPVAAFSVALGWGVLEVAPMPWSVQDVSGKWHTTFGVHLGKGRKIIDPSPNFHITVKERMQDGMLNYKPRAIWTKGTEVYVD
ncbi:DUF2235 domain-containing protein [Mycena indigotica]|uniref:DUF2235 domain-containing protein n=1 Tax=Mycena indigotica TaxID=2126181 RepID=A0A8H6TAL6_9AGAR|nr:DUF2235 domain-containing protein [Mycena indigotica]KAF7314983.1 DUF2235 domain-containing protein [Mycena indigotica]